MGEWKNYYAQRLKSTKERFWEKVDISSDCWEWIASKNKLGYGNFSVDGTHMLAHRYSMILAGHEIPDGMAVLHRCDNPPCVNPSHLYVGTWADNARDRDSRGRLGDRKGACNGNSKLTEADIPRIRDMIICGAPQTEIAKWFGVHPCTISDIKHGRRWLHVN